MKIEYLHAYLLNLIDMALLFEKEYRSNHKRSKLHEIENIGDYYNRWRENFLKEIWYVTNEIQSALSYPGEPDLVTKN